MYLSSEIEIINKYGIASYFVTAMTMAGCELFSGTMDDPEIIGIHHAEEVVPRDHTGQKYPYDVVVSFPVFQLSEGEAMEEMSHRKRMNRQKVKVTVVMFRDLEGYERYMEDGIRFCL